MTASARRRARASRLAAIQTLYQIDRDPDCFQAALAAMLENGALLDEEGRAAAIDGALAAAIVEGASAAGGEIDAAIAAALAPGWSVARLESLLRAVLRAGVFELMSAPSVPAKLAIDDYVGIAHAFWQRGEPGMVNAVLDRIARQLRPGELAARPVPASDSDGGDGSAGSDGGDG